MYILYMRKRCYIYFIVYIKKRSLYLVIGDFFMILILFKNAVFK